MRTFWYALRATILALLPVALLGAASAPQSTAPSGAAIIYNPGNGDFTGFRIVVAPNGEAWASDGAGSSAGQLQASLVSAFFADLAAVPLDQQPLRACPSSQLGGTSIWLNAALNRNANTARLSGLDCASDPRAERLFADALLIQRALYVYAYRTRSTQPNGAANAPVANYGSTLSVNASSAYNNNAASSYAASASTGYPDGASLAGYSRSGLTSQSVPSSTLSGLSSGVSGNAFHLERTQFGSFGEFNGGQRFMGSNALSGSFSNGRFASGAFSNGGFLSGERFNSGGFNTSLGSTRFGGVNTSNSVNNAGFSLGGFSSGGPVSPSCCSQ